MNWWLGHVMRREYLLKTAMEGKVRRMRWGGKRRYQIVDVIKISGKYEATIELAQNRGA